MNVRIEHNGELCVASPDGRIDAVSADELQQILDVQMNATAKRMVIDLTEVDYISSAGLRVMLSLAKRTKQHNGALVLCGMNPAVREVFALAGFLPLFAIEATRDLAVHRAKGA